MILTQDIINSALSKKGALSKKQLAVLGIGSGVRGWKKIILNKDYSEDTIKTFVDLKDKHYKKQKGDIFATNNIT